MADPVGAGDLGAVINHLRNLYTQLGNKDFGSAMGEFFALLDEARKAFPLVPGVMHAGPVDFGEACQAASEEGCCERTKVAAACNELADSAEAGSLDVMKLLTIIMQIAALFRSRA